MTVASYKIRLNGGSLVNYEQNVGNVTSWDQIDPAPATVSGTDYALEVKAIDDTGNESAYCAPVTVNTSAVGLDTDAQAFITAAGITDTTQKSAVNQLVLDLKSASLWTKMNAIYPFVGGTDATHKWNLKDPRDLDAAFRITWNGTPTHDANGVTGNATDAYGDTHYVPATSGTDNDTHLSVYSRTNGQSGVDIGMNSGSGAMTLAVSLDIVGGNSLADGYDGAGGNRINTAPSDSLGLFTVTRTSSTVHTIYRNATSFGTDGSTSSGFSGANISLWLLAQNASGSPLFLSNRNLAVASMGAGLTGTDVTNWHTAVQAFETTLGRQV